MRHLIVYFVCLLSTIELTACTGRTGDVEIQLPDGQKAKLTLDGTLRINISSEPPTLDWHKATDTTSSMLISNLMEGLVQYDVNSNQPKLVPALASSWRSLDNGRRWKFILRKDVLWSDGVPFTEKHVLDAWQRLLTKETAGANAHYLFPIKNARDFNLGKKSWSEVGVKSPAPFEIDVELERPMSFFPYLLRSVITFPIRLEAIEKYGDRWTDPGKIITLGPFQLKSWEHDKLISLERNEKYYGEKASIHFIAAYMIQEQATALNLFKAERLDSLHAIPSTELAVLRAKPEYHESPLYRIYYYGFNVTAPPTDNVLVRRAIAMSIDRNQVVQMLAAGDKPLFDWIPEGLLGYDPAIGIKFDPTEAKNLLRQAGYDGAAKKLPKIELGFNTSDDHSRVAENIQAQLKKNLGIEIEIKNEEWKVYLNALKTRPANLFRLGWQAGYADPDDFMSMMLSYSENNWTRWTNLSFDELVLHAAGEANDKARTELYNRAQRILIEDDTAVIPLFSPMSHFLVNQRIENYPINPFESLCYKSVRIRSKSL